jgi:prepilin-type N-terminal cleavage/methylation domain-containing protein
MNNRGFSLIELVVVIGIMAALLGIVTLDFNSWTKKYQAERQTREMYSDIMQLRLSAMQQKQRCAMFLGSRQYNFKTYTSANEAVLTGGTPRTSNSSKNLNYEIRQKTKSGLNAFDIASDYIEFDSRGFTNNPMTIVVLPVRYNGGDNCILVSMGRTNIGRMEDANTCRAH